MNGQLLTLEQWAAATYATAPSTYTLRRWARDGNISPLPEKHGRTYFVRPGAAYVSTRPSGRRKRLLDRINATGAKRA